MRWFGVALPLALTCLISACAPSLTGESLLEKRLDAPPASTTSAAQKQARLDKFLQSQSTGTAKTSYEGVVQQGNDQLTGKPESQVSLSFDQEGEDVTLSLVNVSVAQAAKSVLGDTLGLSYSVDSRVQGSVTLQTSKPITRSRLLEFFEAGDYSKYVHCQSIRVGNSGGLCRAIPRLCAWIGSVLSNRWCALLEGLLVQFWPLLR